MSSPAARALALTLAACLMLQLVSPSAFVAPAAGVAASAAASGLDFSSMLYSPEVMDAQLLLARIPGGKFAKDRNLVVVSPTDDGFTDNQVAGCLVIALVGFIAAADFAKGLYFGLQPNKFKDGKTKGSVTPLAKRMIELGDA
ncbi:unnamed protein product [Polarella glacialis]|uniref:Uncharacterized protein n=1 Tax=Polarella glacialis TaxID=89957 RepID=A0A813HTJ2_POLGL|nr:unnamed protein product [Polarella glacialis]CAE8641052.1 unnamed protein product [Polarella glacialis]CAE8687915.1 unnamed protein product [Polarella glacialis]|eukprot:CAMPEP_0115079284 /NCGR_PEP_ID=MMETSP0227-20121206/18023_1 /TAXON_ID=89957 /ORGANISM="Polarella glacialis, Strain CCMP 1383" /LENGTH=142 /DNA_ID=CAMNT_0002466771 /DNA_START=88 /DNA_END=516 /DNA_ORIENTATION=+